MDWQDLLVAARVRDARLHDARHTAATLLLTQGVPARVAVQILGHIQISLTLGTYSHVVPELALDAAERGGRSLPRATETTTDTTAAARKMTKFIPEEESRRGRRAVPGLRVHCADHPVRSPTSSAAAPSTNELAGLLGGGDGREQGVRVANQTVDELLAGGRSQAISGLPGRE